MMPKCPNGTRRCPPKTGKCHKVANGARKSAKRVKRNKSAKKSSEMSSTPVPKLTWVNHLKMCTKKFGITYGKAMSDPRCHKLYYETR
jgi:hypothetical protein